MTPRRLLILGALAIVALVASLLLSNQRSSSHQESTATIYPQLKQQLSSVNAVRLFKAGDARAVELLLNDTGWIVSENYGYPADAAKVRKLLLALSQAKTVEEKTSNPQSYPTLGVEDVNGATATGVRVELDGGATPVNLIVGKSGPGAQSAYVRRAGEPASWLINQSLSASTNPRDWLHTEIIDVAADRVQSATIALNGAKAYDATKNSRADADFAVDGVPKGKQLDSPSAANGLASALTGLTLTDVRPLQDFAADKATTRATFKTFDGLVTDLDGWVQDSKHYIAVKTTYDAALAQRFHVETQAPETKAPTSDTSATQPTADQHKTAPAPAAESNKVATDAKIEDAARTANAKLAGWVFEIPEYKYEAIFRPMESLLKK